MKIDIHTHIMPDKMPNWVQKFGYGEFIHLEHRNCKACMMKGDKLFREVEDNCFDAAVRLKEMDDTAVTCQVLSTIPVLFNYWAKAKDGAKKLPVFLMIILLIRLQKIQTFYWYWHCAFAGC
jgi:aminocarboxymuconate-semialdehyde decarboxylase